MPLQLQILNNDHTDKDYYSLAYKQVRSDFINNEFGTVLTILIVAIIGGADGPTVIFLANGSTAKCRTACSSLYFEEQKNIEWRMEFQVKTMEDIVMKIV